MDSILWEQIFQGEQIPAKLTQQGWARLPAEHIRQKYGGRPRILAKMDEYDALPEVFRKHDAAIVSLSNREYAILRLGRKGRPLFPSLPRDFGPSPRYVDVSALTTRILSLPWMEHFTAESQAIDAAVASCILHDFCGESAFVLTVRGRRRFVGELPIRFRRPGQDDLVFPLKAGGFQLEIDAGYETEQALWLIEAKQRIQETYNLRQVYFPYVFWRRYFRARRVGKEVRLLYLMYSSHQYFLVELAVEDENVWNAIRPVRQQWYVLGTPPISPGVLKEILQGAKLSAIPDIPFPQADTLLRIYTLLEMLKSQPGSSEDVAEEQAFTRRQGQYYLNAARWLGWVTRGRSGWELTEAGRAVVGADPLKRARLMIECLASRPVFRQALTWGLQQGVLPVRQQIELWIQEAMQRGEIKPLGGSTISRRAQTAERWLRVVWAYVDVGPRDVLQPWC